MKHDAFSFLQVFIFLSYTHEAEVNKMADLAAGSSKFKEATDASSPEASKQAEHSHVTQNELDFDEAGLKEGQIIPVGALDPVYEAKARLLNQAVRRTLDAK